MFKNLYPGSYENSAYEIDYEGLYERGYRGLIFDIDNTLVPHGAPADSRSIELFGRLLKIGFRTCLISNNQEDRVKSFAEDVGSVYIFDAHKPSPQGYFDATKKMDVLPDKTLLIGDQMFTDIWGAGRAGLSSVMVRKIDRREEIQIVFKRILEALLLCLDRRYRLHRRRCG